MNSLFGTPQAFVISLFIFIATVSIGYRVSALLKDGDVIVNKTPIGNVEKVEFLKPLTFFGSDTQTVITTEKGSFLIQGAASPKNDMPLEKQIMKSGNTRICDSSICWWMVEDGVPQSK
ncbi:MAG: hypothetical protein V4568_01705 [Pseudomonadota bacterium]